MAMQSGNLSEYRTQLSSETLSLLRSARTCTLSLIEQDGAGDSQIFSVPNLLSVSSDLKRAYLHCSSAGRLFKRIQPGNVALCVQIHGDTQLSLKQFPPVSTAVSVTIHGKGSIVSGKEESNESESALRDISERVLKGRWDHVRVPNSSELNITAVIRLDITRIQEMKNSVRQSDVVTQSYQFFSQPSTDKPSKEQDLPIPEHVTADVDRLNGLNEFVFRPNRNMPEFGVNQIITSLIGVVVFGVCLIYFTSSVHTQTTME